MSESVIVIQAPIKSGAMITARYAIEQNRELFVCPGNTFDEKYSGCHELIKQGASILTDMNDLFIGMDPDFEPVKLNISDKNTVKNSIKNEIKNDLKEKLIHTEKFSGIVENKIAEELQSGSMNIDEFIRKNNYLVDEVNQGITVLEISGYIERRGNKIFKV